MAWAWAGASAWAWASGSAGRGSEVDSFARLAAHRLPNAARVPHRLPITPPSAICHLSALCPHQQRPLALFLPRSLSSLHIRPLSPHPSQEPAKYLHPPARRRHRRHGFFLLQRVSAWRPLPPKMLPVCLPSSGLACSHLFLVPARRFTLLSPLALSLLSPLHSLAVPIPWLSLLPPRSLAQPTPL